MMLKRNRVVARSRAVAPRNFEIILSVEDRRKFVNFIMLLNTAERSSNVIKNARKKVKQSKIRDGPLSKRVFLFVYSCFIFMMHLLIHYRYSTYDRHRCITFASTCIPNYGSG